MKLFKQIQFLAAIIAALAFILSKSTGMPSKKRGPNLSEKLALQFRTTAGFLDEYRNKWLSDDNWTELMKSHLFRDDAITSKELTRKLNLALSRVGVESRKTLLPSRQYNGADLRCSNASWTRESGEGRRAR